jgi:hypothetical protein
MWDQRMRPYGKYGKKILLVGRYFSNRNVVVADIYVSRDLCRRYAFNDYRY